METDIERIEEYMPNLSADQYSLLRKYYETLLYFNAKVNLVSSATLPFAAKQHFADSVLGLQVVLKHLTDEHPVYDFGSGNGFPGAVLAVLSETTQVVLVERDMRKAEFLKHIKGELKLDNLQVHAQTYESLPRQSVTQGITRALGALGPLTIQMTSLFEPGGSLFHFKGDSWTTELANCPTQTFTKWDIQPAGQYVLPDSTIERVIVTCKRL